MGTKSRGHCHSRIDMKEWLPFGKYHEDRDNIDFVVRWMIKQNGETLKHVENMQRESLMVMYNSTIQFDFFGTIRVMLGQYHDSFSFSFVCFRTKEHDDDPSTFRELWIFIVITLEL